MVLNRLAEDERARVRREIAERAAPFADGAGIDLPALALVAPAPAAGQPGAT